VPVQMVRMKPMATQPQIETQTTTIRTNNAFGWKFMICISKDMHKAVLYDSFLLVPCSGLLGFGLFLRLSQFLPLLLLVTLYYYNCSY
jgi:hypothetical protein